MFVEAGDNYHSECVVMEAIPPLGYKDLGLLLALHKPI